MLCKLLFSFFIIFNHAYVCVNMSHACKCPYRPEVSGCLKLDLQAILSHLTWVLGTKLRSPLRVVCTLNCWPFSPPYNPHNQLPSLRRQSYHFLLGCFSGLSILSFFTQPMHLLACIQTAQPISIQPTCFCLLLLCSSLMTAHRSCLDIVCALLDPVCHLQSAHRLYSQCFFSALFRFEPSTWTYFSVGLQYNFCLLIIQLGFRPQCPPLS